MHNREKNNNKCLNLKIRKLKFLCCRLRCEVFEGRKQKTKTFSSVGERLIEKLRDLVIDSMSFLPKTVTVEVNLTLRMHFRLLFKLFSIPLVPEPIKAQEK